jgi:peptide/nickel transport system substrate-binding protein
MRLRIGYVTIAITALAAVITSCSSGSSSTNGTAASATTPQHGGTLNYLVSGLLSQWDRGLDPASGGAAPATFEDAIFGNLFRLSPSGAIEPVLASGYQVSDGGKVITISLRPGVKFQDGTPFNAQAVAWNIQRDLATVCVCSPVTSWPPLAKNGGITTPNAQTVVLHFTQPYAAVMATLIGSSVNHIASPTAVQKMGEKQFQLHPVGAGPFELVSNVVNNTLTMKRYTGYWQQGRPYLDGLVFKTTGNDETAYEAMLAGSGQAAQLTTPGIIKQASGNSALSVTIAKGTSPTLIQLNTSMPPFNNKLAREAIYYATDAQAIRTHLFNSMFPVAQSFLGPGGLFYQPTVPGYLPYDLAKAKQIVSQLGGLTVSLMGPNDPVNANTVTALQAMWEQAGIHVTTTTYTLEGLIQAFQGKKWQAALQSDGAFDPASGVGLAFRFFSQAPYSGVHDPALDTMMAQAAATFNTSQRASLYENIAKYISTQAYSPFLIAVAPAAVSARNVHGPGLTSGVPILAVALAPYWDEAWIGK